MKDHAYSALKESFSSSESVLEDVEPIKYTLTEFAFAIQGL
jgi:hypothetical protein